MIDATYIYVDYIQINLSLHISYILIQKALTENLDLAKKKLAAASRSKNTVAQGKIWWMNREIEEAKKYAPPKRKSIK